MVVFWDVAPCSLVDIALMMDAVNTSQTSVSLYHTTQRNIPEDGRLHARRRENLKSHTVIRNIFFVAEHQIT
jgi:hypothetical protein